MFPPYDTEQEAKWYYFDISVGEYKLKDGAPEDIQKKYKMYLDARQYLKENHYIA